jgi:SPP1 family predicted phage head-tail adaptor
MTRISGNNKKIDIGQLNKRIIMNLKTIQAPISGVDFSEKLSNEKGLWAMVKSINPKEIISGTNITGIATHLIGIRYRKDVTTQNWIKYNNQFYKILNTDDGISTNKVFLLMYCCLRGDTNLEVNYV